MKKFQSQGDKNNLHIPCFQENLVIQKQPSERLFRESQSASIQDNNNNNAQKQMEIQNARNHHHMWLRLTEGADTKVILMCLIDGDGDSSSIASFGVKLNTFKIERKKVSIVPLSLLSRDGD